MQTRPSNWSSLFAGSHRMEYRIIIDGTEYTANDLMDSPIIEKTMMKEPVIGRCCTGSFSFVIRKRSDHTIPKAAPVIVQCRLKNSDLTTPWVDLGHYWVSNRKGNNILSFTCRDAMLFAGRTYNDRTTFTEWPVSMSDVLTEIAGFMGVEIDSRTNILSGKNYRVDYPNEDILMSEILSFIAAAHGGVFIITENNKLRLVNFPKTEVPSQSIGTAYSEFVQLSTGEKHISRVTLSDMAGNQFTSGDDTGIEITAKCDYATQGNVSAIVNGSESEPGITDKDFIPYSLSGAYIDPLMELGDTFSISYEGTEFNLIAGNIVLSLDMYLTAEIGMGVSDADEDEVPYKLPSDLTASRYVNIQGSYFGNRINRKEGFVSEHIDADGVPDARAILNSGMLALQQKGADGNWIDCIYYDTVEKCYRISGSVEVKATESDSSRVWIQDTAPEVGDSKDLWIDTTDGANTPKRWDGKAWVQVSDSAAKDAKKLAEDAKGLAETANGTASGLLTRVSDVESKITATAIVNAVRSTLNYTYDSAYGRNYALKTAEEAKFVNRILDGTKSATSKSYTLSPKLYDLASASNATLRVSFQMKRTNVSSSGTYLGVWLYYSYPNDSGSDTSAGRGYALKVSDTSTNLAPFVSTDSDWVSCKFNINLFQFNPTKFESLTFAGYSAASDMTGTIQIRNAKVELGTGYTSWTPAPEDSADMSDRIDSINAEYKTLVERVRQAELKITDEAIVSAVTSSETYKTLVTDVGNAQSTANSAASTANSAASAANSAASAASSAQTAANNAATAVETLTTRISEAEQKITAEAIVSTVTQSTTYKTLVTDVGNAKTAANNAATAAGNAQSTANSASASVSALETRVSTAEQKITADAIVSTVKTSTAYSDLTKGISDAKTAASNAQSTANSAASTANSAASTANSAASAANSAQSSVTQLAGEISSKVSAGDIASTINQTAQSVKIDASKIEIGAFTYGNADKNGGLPKSLYCGGQINATTTSTGISASNADWAFWAGSGAFRVAQNGYMYANNANISGTLTAGGWSFGNTGSSYSYGNIGVNMTVLSGWFAGADSSGTRAFYGSSNCDVQYGSDYNNMTYIRASQIKLIVHDGYDASNFASGYCKRSGSGQFCFVCGESSGSSNTDRNASGNLGYSDQYWDYTFTRVLRAGTYPGSSSRAIKQDIESLPEMGEILDQIEPVKFAYKNEPDKMRYGFIYEDMLNILPVVCFDDGMGDPGIVYTDMIAPMLKEIQSLRKRVATLELKGA